MKITINVTNEEARHLSTPHSFMDECGEACAILYKVQKQIDKELRKIKYRKELRKS